MKTENAYLHITGEIKVAYKNKYLMETILIQVNNSKAYKLLEDLEALNVITVLKKSKETKQKLSAKYAGKLPSGIADEMQSYVAESRN